MSCLQKADQAIHGDRNKSYGHPLDDFTCVMTCFRAYVLRKYGVDVPFVAEDWPMAMNFVKIAREGHCHTPDNLVDGPGYWGTLEMVIEERARRESIKAIDHPPESSEYVTALAEAARKSVEMQPVVYTTTGQPHMRCKSVRAINGIVEGCKKLSLHNGDCEFAPLFPKSKYEPPLQSTNSITQVEPGEDCEIPCKCEKCGTIGHSTRHCWKVAPSKPSAASPPHGDNGEGQ